jgi:hypothetical protein
VRRAPRRDPLRGVLRIDAAVVQDRATMREDDLRAD